MQRVSGIPQPIPYQGSKRLIAPTILRHFPGRTRRLIEPFAGSAALSLAAASRSLAQQYWINDGHAPLVRLWREIVERPMELAEQYAHLWETQLGQERAYFDLIRDRFNTDHEPADFLYLLARCVKAAIRYNADGKFNNTPDNRRRGARPVEMSWRLERASALLRGRTRITAWDYATVLEDCTDEDVVYMDPPYQGVSQRRDQRYLPKVDHDDFCDHLAELNRNRIMFAVSYDGRTGDKTYGNSLPKSLQLTHLEICAGRSTQATLLGRSEVTYESLYLSPSLAAMVGQQPNARSGDQPVLL